MPVKVELVSYRFKVNTFIFIKIYEEKQITSLESWVDIATKQLNIRK
jgi:hypothetical protein